AIVPNINRLASRARALGASVVWLYMTAEQDGDSLWPIYHDHFFTEAKGRKHRDELTEGADGHRLWSGLDVDPGDLYVAKSRFSGFVEGDSTLHEQLQERGIK